MSIYPWKESFHNKSLAFDLDLASLAFVNAAKDVVVEW
jgi:hypothetical protein